MMTLRLTPIPPAAALQCPTPRCDDGDDRSTPLFLPHTSTTWPSKCLLLPTEQSDDSLKDGNSMFWWSSGFTHKVHSTLLPTPKRPCQHLLKNHPVAGCRPHSHVPGWYKCALMMNRMSWASIVFNNLLAFVGFWDTYGLMLGAEEEGQWRSFWPTLYLNLWRQPKNHYYIVRFEFLTKGYK